MEVASDTNTTEQEVIGTGSPVKCETDINASITEESGTENQQIGNANDVRTGDFVVPLIPSKSKDPSATNISNNTETTGKNDSNTESEGKVAEKDKKEFPLQEPVWGGLPESSEVPYSLTILKDGIVKNTVDLSTNSRFTFGRHDNCDVVVEHPSCSRYHAVLQYCLVEKDIRKKGFYLYDMGSTHGTYLNKQKVKAKVYNRVRVGYQIKFGGSTRLYIVEVSLSCRSEREVTCNIRDYI